MNSTSDGMDIHVRFVKRSEASREAKALQWGWNGNIVPSTLWDEESDAFVEALRQKFPNGFKIIGNQILPLE